MPRKKAKSWHSTTQSILAHANIDRLIIAYFSTPLWEYRYLGKEILMGAGCDIML
jgi:hypothetical protein